MLWESHKIKGTHDNIIYIYLTKDTPLVYDRGMKLFSDHTTVFKRVELDFPVKVEDFIIEKKGKFCHPEAGDVMETIGVISKKYKDGTVDILFREKI